MTLIDKTVNHVMIGPNFFTPLNPVCLIHIQLHFLTAFLQLKEACDRMTAELMELKANLAQSQQREKKSGSLVQELTAMVKEQKNRISELIKAKKEAVTDLKVQHHKEIREISFSSTPRTLRANCLSRLKTHIIYV